jgi:hypothetical protein
MNAGMQLRGERYSISVKFHPLSEGLLRREGCGRPCVKGRPIGLIWRKGLTGVLPFHCD